MPINILKIPLTNAPQRFAIDLSGRSLILNSTWNHIANTWMVDFIDGVTNKKLISSLALVTGVDLLRQHEHVGIKGTLIAYTDGDPDAVPSLESMGTDAGLYYLVESDD
jgi:hypothetical protein